MRARAIERRRRLVVALAAAGAALTLVVVIGAASASGAAGTPTPTLQGTVVPASTAPRTNPPATAAPTQAPTPRPSVVATRAPTTETVAPTTASLPATTAPTTSATSVAAATPAETSSSATTEAVIASTATTRAAAASSRNASPRNRRIAWTLALMGVLVGGLTVWFWRATRPVPAAMAGLAELGGSRREGARSDVAVVEGVAASGPPVAASVSPVAHEPVPPDEPAWTRDPEPVAMPPSRPDFASAWAAVVTEGGDEAGAADDVVTGPVPVVLALDALDVPAASVPAPVVLDEPEALSPVGEPTAAPWAPPSGEMRPLADAVDGSPAPGDHG